MTPAQRQWIDRASYKDLLEKVRNERPESTWFEGDTGTYLLDTIRKRVNALISQEAKTFPYINSDAEQIYFK